MVHGRCLCEGVAYEIDGELEEMVHCHCSRCRRHHGAAFVTWVGTNRESFRWVKGADLVTEYESSPGGYRRFCKQCGSTLPVVDASSSKVYLPAGALDEVPGARATAHIFVGSKAGWFQIVDGLPQYEEYPS